jgi:septal ring factor EnvC (AmiA/AmiB activator)
MRRINYGFILSVALLFASTAPATDPADQAGAAKEQLKQLQQRISKINSSLRSDREKRQKLLQELESTERKIGKLAAGLRHLEGRMKVQLKQLKSLRKERQESLKLLAIQQQALRRQVRSAYAIGRQERVKMLLNQQDPTKVSRLLVYYDYLNRSRMEQLEEIGDNLDRLRRVEQSIAVEDRRLLELHEQKKLEKQRLELADAGRREVMAALNVDIQQKGNQLNTLQQDAERLVKLLEQLRKQATTTPLEPINRKPFRSAKGKMAWPADGRMVARYGVRKQSGLKWDGVMIAAAEGEEVRAVHHGRVVFADWLRGFGLLLIIDHGGGYMTLYGHNQALLKENGEWVESNEAVATVGRSGGNAATGVYFEVRRKGRPVNPGIWCRPLRGNQTGGAKA